jgi:hypothetical protein
MPAAPSAFVGAAPEVRSIAVPMRSAAALAMRSAARIVPALRKRGRATQAGREQEQQGAREHIAREHHLSVITNRLGKSRSRDMEKSDYASPRAESLIYLKVALTDCGLVAPTVLPLA